MQPELRRVPPPPHFHHYPPKKKKKARTRTGTGSLLLIRPHQVTWQTGMFLSFGVRKFGSDLGPTSFPDVRSCVTAQKSLSLKKGFGGVEVKRQRAHLRVVRKQLRCLFIAKGRMRLTWLPKKGGGGGRQFVTQNPHSHQKKEPCVRMCALRVFFSLFLCAEIKGSL